MEENISNRLNVLDFIITVLGQHEKSLDKSLAKLKDILKRLETFCSDEDLGAKTLNGYSRFPLQEDQKEVSNRNGFELDQPFSRSKISVKKYLRRRQKTDNQPQEYPLTQIELVILNLKIKGNSAEEIALRLDMNQINVKKVIEGLVRKGYLPPDKSLTGLGTGRI